MNRPITPSDVSAVLVTRGDVDLAEVIASLPYDELIVWDNSKRERDEMTYGRTLAVTLAKHRIIYSQDDDIVHPPEHHARLLADYRSGVLTGCMWPEWSSGAKEQGIPDGYDDLVFAGSGSIYDRELPAVAAARYLEHYPLDDFFRLWADCIIGVLAPNRQIDMRFEELPWADGPTRMSDLPDGPKLKGEAIRRARRLRDNEATRRAYFLAGGKPDAHSVYMDELYARLERQRQR